MKKHGRKDSAVTIDVLANDADSNGDALTLFSFAAQSAQGGTLSRSVGTGPGGRDEIIYTPAAGFTTAGFPPRFLRNAAASRISRRWNGR